MKSINVAIDYGINKTRNENEMKKYKGTKSISFFVAELHQPFIWISEYRPFDEGQSAVCAPLSYNFARLETKDDAFAFKRLIHGHSENPWLALRKREKFTTTSSNCQLISSTLQIVNMIEWTVGDPQVSPDVFQNETFKFDECNAMCLYFKIHDGNRITIEDYDCKASGFIVCRNTSGESDEFPNAASRVR